MVDVSDLSSAELNLLDQKFILYYLELFPLEEH